MPNSLLSLFIQSPLLGLLLFVALAISLAFHEFAHAFVSDKLGDPTAKYLGRVTLNPLAHLDPIGTILLVVVGFGWGRPVPFNPINLKNPRRDSAIISFAGPAANFLLALVSAIMTRLVGDLHLVGLFFSLLVLYNLTLCLFNLIPIAPLDGFKVVTGLLPHRFAVQWAQLEAYGIYFLILLVATGGTQVFIGPLLHLGLVFLGVRF